MPGGAVVFAEPNLPVELQSSSIRTHPGFLPLVVTESLVPLHTLRAGSSGYSAPFLAMRPSTIKSRLHFRKRLGMDMTPLWDSCENMGPSRNAL